MKIAQIAPRPAMPPALRRTERIVSYLTEELVRQGDEVRFLRAGIRSRPGMMVRDGSA